MAEVLYSVLLPAHRADAWLVEAVASVEAAMADDAAELVIVANGPDRAAIAAAYGQGAPRRRVLCCELPSLVHALNVGIEACCGTFVARMDSDDVCDPDRFRVQLAAIGKDDIDFLFTDIRPIGPAGEDLVPDNGKAEQHPAFTGAPLWHPTLMVRRDVLVALGGYGNIEGAEDHDLWLRAIEAGYRLGKLPDKGLAYRRHDEQVSFGAQSRRGFQSTIGLDVTFALRQFRWDVLRYAVRNAWRDAGPGLYYRNIGRFPSPIRRIGSWFEKRR